MGRVGYSMEYDDGVLGCRRERDCVEEMWILPGRLNSCLILGTLNVSYCVNKYGRGLEA